MRWKGDYEQQAGKIWKVATVAYLKLLFNILPEETEHNYENPQNSQ
jgi:hypothetical protein